MARSLVVNNIQRQLGVLDDTLSDAERLPPGHLRLFNFYKPSLAAALYAIESVQSINVPAFGQTASQSQTVINKSDDNSGKPRQQRFAVIAPQFSLDPKLVTSFYPAQGHDEQGSILPHIVFSDPHVPWLRQAGTQPWQTAPTDIGNPVDASSPNNSSRGNLTPWLALLVFKSDDLRIAPNEASLLHLDKITAGVRSSTGIASAATPASSDTPKLIYDNANQPPTGAFGMTVADYLTAIQSRVYYEATLSSADFEALKSSTEPTSIIFPLKSQVKAIFSSKDDFKGLQATKYLAHVRQLNTIGFPDAGVSGNGYYSVVISGMTGDMTITSPTNHIVHLVSTEHIDATFTDPHSSFAKTDNSERVGLVSLFSWTYHCIPEAVSFEDIMKNLGKQAQLLRPPKEQMAILKSRSNGTGPSNLAARQLYNRLNSGYTISRWRAPSGDETASLTRGPLTPVRSPEIPSRQGQSTGRPWPALSMTGRDYMIYDKSLGIFDLSYASAWSLGKLLAISDSVFNAALVRFRSAIWNTATSSLRKTANGVQPRSEIIANSIKSVSRASDLAAGKFSGTVSRINKAAEVPLADSVDHPSMTQALADCINAAVTTAAKTSDGTMYDGFQRKSAASSDWEIVFNWVYDCMYLGHVPAHVLFPEPSHLRSHNESPVQPNQPTTTMEALRFFHIDHAWIDCFIDGALSCGNRTFHAPPPSHLLTSVTDLEPQCDTIRLKVKTLINTVLTSKIGDTKRNPPVPRYGFIIRSKAVKMTPDLKLLVKCWALIPDPDKAGQMKWGVDSIRDPLVRHTKLDETTILSLVDCAPEEIAWIEFAQPSHQQRFALGVAVTNDSATNTVTNVAPEIDLIRVYTDKARAPPNAEDGTAYHGAPGGEDWEWKALPSQLSVSEQAAFYDKTTRCVGADAIAEAINHKLVDWGANGCFNESDTTNTSKGAPSSSVFGLQMNDRAYHFKITNPEPNSDHKPIEPWTRKLYLGDGQTGDPHARIARFKSTTLTSSREAAPTKPLLDIDIQMHAPSKQTTSIAKAPQLNMARPVLAKPPHFHSLLANRPPIASGISPWVATSNPQFELLVHPDYRPAPPLPNTLGPTGATNPIFSPNDSLPTQTLYLYDLIFSIRRRYTGDSKRTLSSLTIEVPVATGHDDQKITGTQFFPREPLLKAGDGRHAGVSMAANKRFVPTLFNGIGSVIRDPRWDSHAVLGILLTPRSGTETGSMYLGAGSTDVVGNTIAVRLGEAQLNPIVHQETVMAYSIPKQPVWGPAKVSGATICRVKLTEHYSDGKGDQYSWCSAIKVPGGDPVIDNA